MILETKTRLIDNNCNTLSDQFLLILLSETSRCTSVEEAGNHKILGRRFRKCLRIRTSPNAVINSTFHRIFVSRREKIAIRRIIRFACIKKRTNRTFARSSKVPRRVCLFITRPPSNTIRQGIPLPDRQLLDSRISPASRPREENCDVRKIEKIRDLLLARGTTDRRRRLACRD